MDLFWCILDIIMDIAALDVFTMFLAVIVVFWGVCVILNLVSGTRRSQ